VKQREVYASRFSRRLFCDCEVSGMAYTLKNGSSKYETATFPNVFHPNDFRLDQAGIWQDAIRVVLNTAQGNGSAH
jgi:hypothetical protein